MMGLLLGAGLGTGSVARAQLPSGRTNLLVNGDFAKGMEGWAMTNWQKKGQASMDAAENYQGKPALKIVNSGVDDTQVNQKVTLKPHTRYKLSGMIKTKDVEAASRTSKSGAALSVQGSDLSKAQMKSTPWTRINLEFDSGPKTDALLGARLGHNSGEVAGTAWFADLSLVELGPGRK